MAVLSKHGTELYRVDRLTDRLSFRSDGQIMRDSGAGWKLWKRLKPGVNAVDYAERTRRSHEENDREYPDNAEFRETLCRMVVFKCRFHVLTAIQAMPDDPDGICVELEDYFQYSHPAPELDLDDCVLLCRLYRQALAERERREQFLRRE